MKGRCQTSGRSGRRVERGQRFGAVAGHQHIEAIVDQFDAHHLRWCHTGHVGGVAEQLGQVADPEHLAGPGVVAQLQLEIGERALRLRPGDAAAEGPSSDLPASPAVQCGDQTDGGEPEEAGAHGDRSDVASGRMRSGWTHLGHRRPAGRRGWELRLRNGGEPAVAGMELVPAGSVGSVWCGGTDRTSEGRLARVGLMCVRGVEFPRPTGTTAAGTRCCWTTSLMDPGVPAAGEVTVGAVDEAAGEGACNGGAVVGTTGGAWVAPGMVSDHPG